MLDSLLQDARFAVHLLLGRSRSFTIIAVLSLALGIGVNLSIFSFVNALFLRSIPGVADGERLVAIHHRTRATGAVTSASFPDFEYYRLHSASLSGLAAHASFTTTVRATDAVERTRVDLVSADYFKVLGTQPVVGRLLDTRDASPGTDVAVVISHDYWQRVWGGDAAIAGRPIRVGTAMATIVGVAPRGFIGLQSRTDPPSMWIPVSAYREAVPSLAGMADLPRAWGAQTFRVVGRLKPDTDRARAAVEIRTLAVQLDTERAAGGVKVLADYRRLDAAVVPAEQSRLTPGEADRFLSLVALLFVVAVVILLIACFNVATLTVARATAREHEAAIRCALGATWRRLVQQTLVENIVLVGLALVAALPAAVWTSRVLTGFGPSSPLSVAVDAVIDGRVMAFGAGLALVTAVLLSLLPARIAARASLSETFGRRSRGATSRAGLQSALVVAQVALSVVLLVGAGLFTRTLRNALAVDATVRSEQVLLARVDTSTEGYDATRGGRLYATLLDRIRALPGVVDAAAVFVVPLGGRRGGTDVEWSSAGEVRRVQVGFNSVSPRHFQTIGVPILAGRDFAETDRTESAKVAIVNQALAEQFFRGRSAIGQRLVIMSRPAAPIEIVGVVRDGPFRSYRSRIEPTVYLPLQQRYVSPITIEVRAAGALALVPAIRSELMSLDRNLSLTAVQTARAYFEDALWRERMVAALVGGLGGLALLLVALGLYGILSFMIAQRTREIGVRMALGAPAGSVLWLVLGRALAVVGIGAAIGALTAVALSRYIRSLLYGVHAGDPLVILASGALLVGVALAASVVPARRAVQVDPVTALRAE